MLLSTVNVWLLLLMPILESMPYAAAAQDSLAIPETFAAAKSGNVEQFAVALAKAKVPVGVILLEKDVKSKPNSLDTVREPHGDNARFDDRRIRGAIPRLPR